VAVKCQLEAGGAGGGRREEAGGRRPGAREEAGGRRPGAREEAGGACVLRRLRAPAACSGGACVLRRRVRALAPAAACLDRERGFGACVHAGGRKSPKRPFVPVPFTNRY
jgi:hypothetical protein